MGSAARADVTSKAAASPALRAGIVVVLALVPYLNALRGGFTYDDRPLVAENPRIRSAAGIARGFTSDWWDGTRPRSLLYRPLAMASFGIDHAVARWGQTGPEPARLPERAALPFHAHNLLWHAAASLALYALVLGMFASPWLAVAAASLFAVHPVHTEAVNGIVGRAELMSACFGFLALLAARRSRPLLAAAMLLLALLSKEQAIAIPIAALFAVPWRRDAGSRRALLGLAGAVVVYLALRSAVLGSPLALLATPPGGIDVDNPIAGASGGARILTPLSGFARAVGLLAFPGTLSADYSYDQIPLVASADRGSMLGLAALALAVAAAAAFRKRAPAVSFGCVLLLASWLVTSNLLVTIGTIFGERLLYLPSAGACIAVAAGLRAFPSRRWAAAALIALLAAGASRTWARNPDWRSNASLFASAVRASPRSCKALDGYASELLASGRPGEAAEWAERSLAIYPAYPNASLTLAKSLRALAAGEADPGARDAMRGRAEDAARSVLRGNSSADAWSVIGGLALDAGRIEDARAAFEAGLQVDARFVPALIGLGVVHARRGRAEEAAKTFAAALALDPGNEEAERNAEAATQANLHGLRGQQLLEQRLWEEAIAEFREASRLEPGRARGYLGAGAALAGEADAEANPARREALIDEAIASFEKALEVEPGEPTAHMNLGIIYLRQRRDPAKVVEQFRAYLRLVPDAPQRAQMEGTIRQMERALP